MSETEWAFIGFLLILGLLPFACIGMAKGADWVMSFASRIVRRMKTKNSGGDAG